MATEQKQKLEQQLWNIASTRRGKMDADDLEITYLVLLKASLNKIGKATRKIQTYFLVQTPYMESI